MNNKTPNVLLLSLPWTAFTEPSLGLGLLKSQLNNAKIKCTVKHLNFFLLKYMRASTYLGITNMYAVNDFFFTYVFERDISEKQLSELSMRIDEAIFYNHFGNDERYKTREAVGELFLKIRNKIIPEFLLDCLKVVEESDATMVGFTCMFDQTIASLALAKLVKEKFPDKLIVFGGYALEGDVGVQIMESFDFVDCVCYGEGESVIEKLAYASTEKELLKSIPDVLYREKTQIKKTTTPKRLINMDESPIPDYDDFINDLRELKNKYEIEIKNNTLPIETSRGCWWGQKNHCIFCGIDDITMRYRQRSEDNTLNMLTVLREKYKTNFFRISDYILPSDYYKTLLPILAKINRTNKEKFVFTCEIKANVTNENFRLLSEAGVIEVQPGIESFSTNVLKKMSKGVSAIQNIYCLLLGHKHSIRINYNVLFGFPEEDKEDYEYMLKTIPLLYHLNPPSTRVEVAITRFAPMQINPEQFHIAKELKYNPDYDVIFSPDFLKKHNFDLLNYCYYFQKNYIVTDELKNLYRLLIYQIDYWKNIHENREVRLFYRVNNKGIVFYDSRFEETLIKHTYNNKYARVYLECTNQIITFSAIVERMNDEFTKNQVVEIIDKLIEDRFIYKEGNKLIGLALEESVYDKLKPESKKWTKPYI